MINVRNANRGEGQVGRSAIAQNPHRVKLRGSKGTTVPVTDGGDLSPMTSNSNDGPDMELPGSLAS